MHGGQRQNRCGSKSTTRHTYTITSAALKLLLRRLILLRPGRPVVFEVGSTTTDALFVIHASDSIAGDPFPAFFPPVVGEILTSLNDDVWCGRFEGINVGNLDGGGGDDGGLGLRASITLNRVVMPVDPFDVASVLVAFVAAAAALAAAVVRVVANLGILLGPCPDLTGEDGGGFVEWTAAVPAFLIFAAPAVDLVTRVGLCSDAVMPLDSLGFTLFRVIGGTMPNAGSSSSASSSSLSESWSDKSLASRLAIGVFRGCPGGAISPAFAVAAAICLLGVTGGSETVGNGGVVCIWSSCSSGSAGGVAGVTRVGDFVIAVACDLRSSSSAAHLVHSNCLIYIYCC